MPRRRTTRAATSKRSVPALSDDTSENKNLDEEQRRHKVETLILDFKNEISSRIRDLKQNLTNLLSQIDLAYSVEIMQIGPELRNMKLADFLSAGGSFKKPTLSDNISSEIQALIYPLQATVGDENCVQTTVKKRQQKPKTSNNTRAIRPSTQRVSRSRKAVDETPANNILKTLSMATPLITPKFDPRLYQTPAVLMRPAKPGEVIVSMEGSPITNLGSDNQNAGLLVPIDDSKSMWLWDSCDLSNVDQGAIKKAYQTIDEMRARLAAVLKNKPTAE